MFIDIRTAKKKLDDDRIGITEFYPMIEDSVLVPASQVAGKPMYAFTFCKVDAYSYGGLSDEMILSKEEYIKELKRFLKSLDTNTNKAMIFDEEQLYDRYVLASQYFSISGVVNFISEEDAEDIIATSTYPIYLPPEGLNTLIDIESYWKSAMFVLPNLIMDVSTVINMYDIYLKETPADTGKKARSSTLLLNSWSLNDLLDDIKKALDKTDIEYKDIRRLAKDSDLTNSSEMTKYYKRMIADHEVNINIASGYVYYVFESFYKKNYESCGIEDLWETDRKMVVKIPTRTSKKNKSNGFF